MKRLRVSAEVKRLTALGSKYYLTSYAESGYEFGFGQGGSYRGHSHKQFVDVLFSPNGIRLARGGSAKFRLVIAPARTYLPDVQTGDFAFLKFCPTDDDVILPDKVEDELHEQSLLTFDNEIRLEFPFYQRKGAQIGRLEITMKEEMLEINISDRFRVQLTL